MCVCRRPLGTYVVVAGRTCGGGGVKIKKRWRLRNGKD